MEVQKPATNERTNELSTLEVQTLSSEGDGWIKLEFDKTYFFYEVIIYYWFFTNWYKPTEWCVLSEANFRACVDTDKNVDVSVYKGTVQQKSCGKLQLTYGLEQSDQIYTLICKIEGDTVKLSKTIPPGNIAVFEVVVTGTG